MKTLNIKRIDDPEEAKNAWNKLSPDKTISDNWDYRYCFYKYFNYPLFFYAGYDGEELVGLLPLQYDKVKNYLTFFGGNFMSDNSIFIKPQYEECIPQFYSDISEPAILKNISGMNLFTKSLQLCKYKYVANISNIGSANDYLEKYLKGKTRKKIEKALRSIETLNPVIIENDFKDFDLLVQLNKEAFGERSLFYKPYKFESYRDLLELNLPFYVSSYAINGKKEAVTLSVKHKDTFFGINGGVNKKDVPNLGTYTIFKKMELAIKLEAKYYDAGLDDLGWKEKWKFEKEPQYLFSNNKT